VFFFVCVYICVGGWMGVCVGVWVLYMKGQQKMYTKNIVKCTVDF
jgi:hypothetical protein